MKSDKKLIKLFDMNLTPGQKRQMEKLENLISNLEQTTERQLTDIDEFLFSFEHGNVAVIENDTTMRELTQKRNSILAGSVNKKSSVKK